MRPGEVCLPPSSTLEAHLQAYAQPLGLVAGEGGVYRLTPPRPELLEAVLALTPEGAAVGAPTPEQTVALGELTGRMAKSEWGITREQSELLLAALLRLGYLVALDTFLHPLRFEQVAAPLSDFLPYLTRGRPVEGEAAGAVLRLWPAATGGEGAGWDLPTQERAWRELAQWAERTRRHGEAHRAGPDSRRRGLRPSAGGVGFGAGLPRAGRGGGRRGGRLPHLPGGT